MLRVLPFIAVIKYKPEDFISTVELWRKKFRRESNVAPNRLIHNTLIDVVMDEDITVKGLVVYWYSIFLSLCRSPEWRFITEDERRIIGLSFDHDGEFWMSFQVK